MNSQGSGSWTFERPFRFVSSGNMEDVVRNLSYLEEGGGFFNSSRDEMSILPMRDGYTFRYRIRRRNKNNTYTTAFAEGEIYQDEGGHVVVEGTAQIDPWSLYGSIGIMTFAMVMFGLFARGMFGIFPLIFLGVGAFMIFSYYNDRNRVIDRIGESVDSTISIEDRFRYDKEKHSPIPLKDKNDRLMNEEPVRRPDSIWNEAISEYEDDEQGAVR